MHRTARPYFTALAAAIGLSIATAARADGERVLVVTDDPEAALAQRLRSELASARYVVDVRIDVALRDVAALAAARDARAVLSTLSAEGGVDVWIAGAGARDLRFVERVAPPVAGADPSLTAIRAREIVHASLLPIPRVERVAAPPAPDAAPPPVPPKHVAGRLGLSGTSGPGGVPPMGNVALGLSWLAGDRLSADFDARIPVLTSPLQGPEGSARVAVAEIGAGASLALTPRTASLVPSLGAGLAFAWTHVEGTAAATFVSSSADVFALVPFARVAGRLALSDGIGLRVDAIGGVALPSVAVTFADRRVATFGNPFFDLALTLEVAW